MNAPKSALTIEILELAAVIRRGLEHLEQRAPTSERERISRAFSVLKAFDTLSGKLYSLRAQAPASDPTRQRTEDTVATLSHDLLALRRPAVQKSGWYSPFAAQYRQVWRRHFMLFFFCVMLFAASSLLGWGIGTSRPEYITLILPQELQEQVLDHVPWFQKLQENPLLGAFSIGLNNIRVAIFCFSAAALLGLGGLVILCYNGLLFGAVMGFCYAHGFHNELTNFVAAHGPLELTIIIASSFAGLLYGQVFFMRPYRLFAARFRQGAASAGKVIMGVTPWLVPAAIFEGFVSPWGYLSFGMKLACGFAIAAAFWMWTFFPSYAASEERTRP